MFAIIEAQQNHLLSKKFWIRNLISGVIVGVVALPLGMAFAIASGAKPEQGIYTSIIAAICVSLFGGSRVQIAGPTGAFIVVLSVITSKYGITGLQIATMMAGVILLLFGFAKMGTVIKFIPAPVIIGFTSGIGVTIWVGQWQDFFGLPSVSAEFFHERLMLLFKALPLFDSATTLLAITSLLLVIYSNRIPLIRKVPGPLVALVFATVIQYLFQFETIKTIGSAFGGIPQGLPEFSFPEIEGKQIIQLIGPAFTIAMLGSIESLLSAVVADGMAGTKHNSNQELIGQGLANIIAPLFGGFAATGAIARTATNIRNGGNSPLSGIIHSITLILILLVLAPLAVHIPLATLAAILFVVAWNMSEAGHFIRMVKQAPRADVVILLITFSLTVFSDLVVAVNIGVILATLHFLRRMASSVQVTRSSSVSLDSSLTKLGINAVPEDMIIFTLDGPFFFAAVGKFDHALADTHTDPKTVVIDLHRVPFMDITGLQALENSIIALQKRHIRVVLAGANNRVAGKLAKAEIICLLGETNYFSDVNSAVSCLLSDS